MKKISMQTGDLPLQFGIDKGYALIAEAGFEGIDWSLDHGIKPSMIRDLNYRGNCLFDKSLDEVMTYYEPSLKAIRREGLAFSQAHAIFPSYIYGHPEIIDWAVEMHKRTIELVEAVDCPHLVIHSVCRVQDMTDEETETLNMRLYMPLADFLRDRKTTVCLEDLFIVENGQYKPGCCVDPAQAVRYIDRLNERAGRPDAFGFCLDTGHLLLLKQDPVAFVHTLGKRITALHLHDNPGNSDAHLAPLTGAFDWNGFLAALKDVGYSGDLSFETFMQTNKAFDVDPDLVLPWLKLIRAEGECFRKKVFG